MSSHTEVLDISSDSTMEQIEAAFQEKSEYWRRLQANPKRSAEAAAMLEQVIVAYETLRASSQSAASGLEYREPRSFGGQIEAASVDKDSCPHCGHRGNPPDARFCAGCGKKLFQICPNPNCQTELPWHYEHCHRCGVHIDEEKSRLEVEQRQNEIQAAGYRQRRLQDLRRKRELLADEWLVFNRGSEQNQIIDEFNQGGKRAKMISIIGMITGISGGISFALLPLSLVVPMMMDKPYEIITWIIPTGLIFGLFSQMYFYGVRSRNAKRPIALKNCERAIAELERWM